VKHKTATHDSPRVVGYAVLRDSCVVELVTLPGHAAARLALVARACREAMDRDHHSISLHTPTSDPLHELLVTAGGNWRSQRSNTPRGWMVKLLAPQRWVERFGPQFMALTRSAGIPRPLEYSISDGQDRSRFVLTRRRARWESEPAGVAVDIECAPGISQDLLLGNLDWSRARTENLLRCRDAKLESLLEVLFPARTFWQSPLEWLTL
jgi:hypothetical protein